MTLSTTSSKTIASGNGVTTVFSFSFPVLAAGDLVVIYTDTTGTETTLSAGVYTTTGIGATSTGGTVTYPTSGSPIATGTSLTIMRVVTLSQGTSITSQGAFDAAVLEGADDYGMMASQQLNEKIGRAVVIPPADSNTMTLPPAAQRANFVFGFDASGNPVMLTATAATGIFTNVKDYGALGNNSHDDTSAIASALAVGGRIYFPAGTYKVTSGLTVAKASLLFGDGVGVTIISCAFASGDLFNVTSSFVEIEDIEIDAAVTRSAGAFIKVAGAVFNLRDFLMTGYFIGIEVNANVVDISRGRMINGVVTTGVGILVDSTADLCIRSIVIDAPTGSRPSTGIKILSCLDMAMHDVQVIHQALGLNIVPGTSQTAASFYAQGCNFDTCTSAEIQITTSAASGVVERVRFVGCWASSGANVGVNILAGSGTIDGVEFDDLHCFANASDGVLIGDSGPINVALIGGFIAQNGNNGFEAAASATKFSLVGVHLGSSNGFTGNVGYGAYLNTGTNTFKIVGCTFSGNTVGPIAGAPTGNVILEDNLGVTDVIQTVASAGTLAVTLNPIVKITGNTGVGAITGGWVGRKASFVTTGGAVVFTVGASIAKSYTSTQNLVFDAVCDGTLWYLG